MLTAQCVTVEGAGSTFKVEFVVLSSDAASGKHPELSKVAMLQVIQTCRLVTEELLVWISLDIAEVCKGLTAIVVKEAPVSLVGPLATELAGKGIRVLCPETSDGIRRWYRDALTGKLTSYLV